MCNQVEPHHELHPAGSNELFLRLVDVIRKSFVCLRRNVLMVASKCARDHNLPHISLLFVFDDPAVGRRDAFYYPHNKTTLLFRELTFR